MIVLRPLVAVVVFVGLFVALTIFTLVILLVGVASYFRRRAETISILSTNPLIRASIVIPTWNGWDLLEQCLPSVVGDVSASEGEYEIIVVDNASTDGTSQRIADQFPSVKVLRQEANTGFGGGCNAGAREATGQYIVVLNNDMKVEPGFLRELLAGFQHPDTFAVTSQISFWDQDRPREETGLTRGGIERGQLWLTHDRPDPDDDWVTYPAVLYAGGGSSAYHRTKYLALGGFDRLYHPFYVEDVDLSYRAWRRGWPSVLAPRAKVLHKHRGTIGKHFNPDEIRDIVDRNKLLFVWRNVASPLLLAESALWNSLTVAAGALHGQLNVRPLRLAVFRLSPVLAAIWRDRRHDIWSDRRVIKMASDRLFFRDWLGEMTAPIHDTRLKVVVMSPYALFPPRHGGATRMYNIVKRQAARHSVRLLCYVDTEDEQREMAELEALGIRVTSVIRRPPVFRFDSLGPIPRSVGDFDTPEMNDIVLHSPSVAMADVLHVEYTQMAHFIRPSRYVMNVLTEIDVSFVSLFRSMQRRVGLVPRLSAWFDWLRMFDYELDVCRRADLVLTVSSDEADLLTSYLPTQAISADVPTGVDVAHFLPRAQETVTPNSVLFVGYFRHPPNVEAVLELGRDIFPRLKEILPAATLTIVGAHPPLDVRDLAVDPAIRVLGFVDDVRDYYRTHAVLAAPIRTGAGTRVKILEAMAAGVPVVTTTIGAEGIRCETGVNILIGDDPGDMVRQLARVLGSPAHAQNLALAARQLISAEYDWDVLVERLNRLYVEHLDRKRLRTGVVDAAAITGTPSRPTA